MKINGNSEKISDLKSRKIQADKFFKAIDTIREPVVEFDENLWNILVENMVVYGKCDIRVVWRDGEFK